MRSRAANRGVVVEEVKIHSGTRIKLKHINESELPSEFVSRLREFAHKDDRILAIFFFGIQPEDQAEQPSMAVAVKKGLFGSSEERFLSVVDEIQMLLPDDLALNLYRFGASDFLTRYLVADLDPLYLRSSSWLAKQKKRLS
jgi:hypothetical protein